jgi:hypothetical protein
VSCPRIKRYHARRPRSRPCFCPSRRVLFAPSRSRAVPRPEVLPTLPWRVSPRLRERTGAERPLKVARGPVRGRETWSRSLGPQSTAAIPLLRPHTTAPREGQHAGIRSERAGRSSSLLDSSALRLPELLPVSAHMNELSGCAQQAHGKKASSAPRGGGAVAGLASWPSVPARNELLSPDGAAHFLHLLYPDDDATTRYQGRRMRPLRDTKCLPLRGVTGMCAERTQGEWAHMTSSTGAMHPAPNSALVSAPSDRDLRTSRWRT